MAFQLAGTKRLGSAVSEFERPSHGLYRRIHYDLTEGQGAWVEYLVAGDFLEFPADSGFWVPSVFEYGTARHELPYAVRMTIAKSPLTAPRVLSLSTLVDQSIEIGELGGKPAKVYSKATSIRSDGLRQVPVARLLADALLCASHPAPGKAPDFLVREEEIAASFEARRSAAQGARTLILNDAHYAKVAEVYRSAPSGRNAAIRRAFNVAAPTAGRYIVKAREKGFLGKAPAKGKAGEVE